MEELSHHSGCPAWLQGGFAAWVLTGTVQQGAQHRHVSCVPDHWAPGAPRECCFCLPGNFSLPFYKMVMTNSTAFLELVP